MRPLVQSLVIVVVTAAIAAAATSPPADAIDGLEGAAKLDALLERVVERQRALRSLRADFVQHKSSEMLLGEHRSSGVFLFQAPDRVRWDYDRPDPMVVLFADGMVTTYHPDQSRAQRIKVSGRQRRFVGVLAGTQPLDELAGHFRITFADPGGDAPYRLTLQPVDRMVAKRLRSVQLEIDRRLFLPVTVEYLEADGDSTRYEFRNLELDPRLDETSFHLELEAGVELETLDASAGVG